MLKENGTWVIKSSIKILDSENSSYKFLYYMDFIISVLRHLDCELGLSIKCITLS